MQNNKSTLTIRLPNDKHERLKMLAKQRHISVNKLMEEISTIALAEFDAEIRFRARAAKGNPKEALKLLDTLNKHFDNKNYCKGNSKCAKK